MRDRVKFRITSHDRGLRAHGCTDRKGIRVGERKLRFHPGGCEDVGEGIGHQGDREHGEAMEKVLGLCQGVCLGKNVKDLANVDLIHQQGLCSGLGRIQQRPLPFPPP